MMSYEKQRMVSTPIAVAKENLKTDSENKLIFTEQKEQNDEYSVLWIHFKIRNVALKANYEEIEDGSSCRPEHWKFPVI